MRKMALLRVAVLIVFLWFPLAGAASSIVGLYGTGLCSSGVPPCQDANWFLNQWPGGGSGTSSAWVIGDSAFPFSNPGWVANDPNSRWIGFNAYIDPLDEPTGGYSFFTQFTWNASEPEWITISGQWSSDNSTQMTFLNGVGTGVKLNDDQAYLEMHPFAISGWVYPGPNVLWFQVQNANSGGYDPVGLRVSFEDGVVPPSEIPEPATATMLALGLTGLAAGWLCRRNSRV